MAGWIHNTQPKWQNSQQCEALWSCMPQASAMDARSTQAKAVHTRTFAYIEVCFCNTFPLANDYITVASTTII